MIYPQVICDKVEGGYIKQCRRCGDWLFHHSSAKLYCDNCVKINNKYLTYKWRKLRKKILERDNYICQSCGEKANAVDHIIPVALNGIDDENNLRAICKKCNSKKGKNLITIIRKESICKQKPY